MPKRFPIQGGFAVPWSVAETAYATYRRLFGGQSLERLAERGGFGLQEFGCLFCGHSPCPGEHCICKALTAARDAEIAAAYVEGRKHEQAARADQVAAYQPFPNVPFGASP